MGTYCCSAGQVCSVVGALSGDSSVLEANFGLGRLAWHGADLTRKGRDGFLQLRQQRGVTAQVVPAEKTPPGGAGSISWFWGLPRRSGG
jgi:hypothetical protein